MKKSTVVEIISALFILLFLYTALSKTVHIGDTSEVLKKTPILSNIAVGLSWTIVIVEYLIAALLFLPQTKRIGLYASFGIMFSFICYIIYMKLFIPHLPCSCGGVISKLTWTQHLIFNIIFAMLALLGIRLERGVSRKNEFDTNLLKVGTKYSV